MKSNNYWRKRFLYNQIFNAKRMNRVSEEYAELFKELIKELDKEITYWYLQFAKDGELTSLKSKKMLNQTQLKQIKTDVYDFINKAKENGINGNYTKELDYIYNRVRLNRLELLRSVIDMELIDLYSNIDNFLKNELEQTYTEAQGRTVYEISKGNGKLIEWSLPTKEMIDVILLNPWASDGRNFSDTLWHNKAKLLNALETELRKGFVMGKSVQQITNAMSDKIYSSKQKTATAEYQIRRIVHTEIGHFAEEAKTKVLQDLDVKKYEIDATLDSHTCSVCGSKDKEVYSYDDRIEGVTAPVFHPFCRCTTAPYFPDDFEDSERFARDKDGKPIYVPNSMKYSEYYEKYLKNNNNSDIIKEKPRTNEDIELHSIGKLKNKLYKDNFKYLVTDEVIITDKQIQHIKERRGEEFYFKYKDKFIDIINEPDYILKDNSREHTLIVCKQLNKDDKSINVVLRLAINVEKGYKNSIITVIGESNKRFLRTIKNKKILYKKE